MKGFGGPSGGGHNERGLSAAVSSDPHLLSAPGPLSQDRGENKSRMWCLRRALCVKSYSQDFVKFINGFFFFFKLLAQVPEHISQLQTKQEESGG